jgi:tetratricopeptide (TPR) repeat protein
MKKIAFLITALLCTFNVFTQTIDDAGKKFNDGNEQFKANNYSQAIKNYEEAISICEELGEDGNDLKAQASKMIPRVKLTESKIFIKDKNYDQAISALNETIDVANKYNDANTAASAKKLISNVYIINAQNAYKQKDFDNAIKQADLALKNDPTAANAHIFKALSYSELDDEQQVYNSINKVLEVTSEKDSKVRDNAIQIGSSYFTNKGQVLLAENKFNVALEAFDKALEIDSESENLFYLKASCLNKLERYDDAIATGNKGLEVPLKSQDIRNGIHLELARAYEAKGDTNNACTNYKQAAKTKAFEVEANQKIKDVLKCN